MTDNKTNKEGEFAPVEQEEWESCEGLEAICAVCKSVIRIAIRNAVTEERKRIEVAISKIRRTDENHMSHDHTFDEALDAVLSIINSEDNK